MDSQFGSGHFFVETLVAPCEFRIEAAQPEAPETGDEFGGNLGNRLEAPIRGLRKEGFNAGKNAPHVGDEVTISLAIEAVRE